LLTVKVNEPLALVRADFIRATPALFVVALPNR
jgi:hypothetical protein